MKILSACLVLLFVSIAYAAVSLEDIVQLSKSKTRDDVILQLIQKEGLTKPVTSKDIVYLKQKGVSDRVIQYLMKLSADKESPVAEKNLRSYYTTNKNGKRIRVVTNLDENGKRMGGPVPPDPAPQREDQAVYQPPSAPPQEIRVVVENGSERRDPYEEEYPEYVDDRYTMPPFPSYYPYSSPYYPYYPLIPRQHHHKGKHFPKDPNQPNWNFDYSKNRPIVEPRRQQSGRTIPGSKPAGTARRLKGN